MGIPRGKSMKKILLLTNRYKDTDGSTTKRVLDFLAAHNVQTVQKKVDRRVKSLDETLLQGVDLAVVKITAQPHQPRIKRAFSAVGRHLQQVILRAGDLVPRDQVGTVTEIGDILRLFVQDAQLYVLIVRPHRDIAVDIIAEIAYHREHSHQLREIVEGRESGDRAQLVRDVQLKVRGALAERIDPQVKGIDLTESQLFGLQKFHQRIQIRQRVAQRRTCREYRPVDRVYLLQRLVRSHTALGSHADDIV